MRKTVNLFAEMEYDLDFRVPRVTVTENRVILESVKQCGGYRKKFRQVCNGRR